jgi:hypothetical protein
MRRRLLATPFTSTAVYLPLDPEKFFRHFPVRWFEKLLGYQNGSDRPAKGRNTSWVCVRGVGKPLNGENGMLIFDAARQFGCNICPCKIFPCNICQYVNSTDSRCLHLQLKCSLLNLQRLLKTSVKVHLPVGMLVNFSNLSLPETNAYTGIEPKLGLARCALGYAPCTWRAAIGVLQYG